MYYTLQKVSIFMSAFYSLLLIGLIHQIAGQEWRKSETFGAFVGVWSILFVTHYSWLTKIRWNGYFINYTEVKKYSALFVILMFLSIAIWIPLR